MADFPLVSLGFYCIFGILRFYVQHWGANFRGESEVARFVIVLSGFLGLVVGLGFLIYLGWNLVWWHPLVFFAVGMFASMLGVLLEKIFGYLAVGMAGLVGWPVFAFLMFYFLPL